MHRIGLKDREYGGGSVCLAKQSFCNGADFKVSHENLFPTELHAEAVLKKNIWGKQGELGYHRAFTCMRASQVKVLNDI